MAHRAGSCPGDLMRPGELPLGDTSALARHVSQLTAGDVAPRRPSGRGGDVAAMKSIQKILVPVDFSGESDRAFDAAVELAREFDSELHVMHALDIRVPLMTPYEVVLPVAFIDEARRALSAKLDALVQKVTTEGLSAVSHLCEAPAASAIVDLARKIEADLIVMGTRGHTGLKHVLLGSVAERTLREAPCSVLAVKGSAR